MRISKAQLDEVRRQSWRLPFRVRLYKFETHHSYYARLVRANYCDFVSLEHRARLAGAAYPEQVLRKSELAVELMSQIPVGTFYGSSHEVPVLCAAPDCRCSELIACGRQLCLQCARGESVELVANVEPYVCVRHQRWVGPGVGAGEQISTRSFPEYIHATAKHRKLRRAGALDPLRFRAIWRLLTHAYVSGWFRPRTAGIRSDWRFRIEKHAAAVTYPAAIALYQELEEGAVLGRVLHPRNDLRNVEEALRNVVEAATGTPCDPRLAREVRYHLRGDFYRVALASTPGWHDGALASYPPPKVAFHDRDLSVIDYSTWPTRREGVPPGYPGFDDPQSPMFILLHPGREFRHEFWYDPRGDLFDDLKRIPREKSIWICRVGHVLEVAAVSRERAVRTGCKACSNKILVPGVTDIATTHPKAFQYWDHAANLARDLRYWEVSAVRPTLAIWRFPDGHSFPAFIPGFVKNPVCRVCYEPNQKWVDLAREHPSLVEWWDTHLNIGLDLHFLAVSEVVAWRCVVRGHPFPSTLIDLLRRRQPCPVCSGRRIVSGLNDFQTLYPEQAEEFSLALNGGVSPGQLSPGNQRTKYLWVCRRKGHIYSLTVYERVLGYGCHHCTGRRVIPGETDFQSVNPGAAARWDAISNGNLSPRDLHPGTNFEAYFTCLCDRPYRCQVKAMRADRYCRRCTNALNGWRRERRHSAS